MLTSLFENNAIVTTVHKAKALRPLTDKLVGLAKKGDLSSYRRALTYFTKRKVAKTLFAKVKDDNLFSDRVCGYSSMGRIGLRKGDASVMVKIVLIGPDYAKAEREVSKTRKIGDRSRRVQASRAKQEVKAS
jgi:large subunit ribosomal protein L17